MLAGRDHAHEINVVGPTTTGASRVAPASQPEFTRPVHKLANWIASSRRLLLLLLYISLQRRPTRSHTIKFPFARARRLRRPLILAGAISDGSSINGSLAWARSLTLGPSSWPTVVQFAPKRRAKIRSSFRDDELEGRAETE